MVECDTIAPPTGPENPYGNAFYVEERPLTTEREARRNSDFARMRYWKIINPEARNWVGTPTAYKLEAGSAVQPFTDPDSPSGRRGRFIQHQLWVTPFHPEERFPAGEFVNQSRGDDGLPAWTAQRSAASRTPISCCGTVSDCIICRGRRIIRCSPASSAASSCCRSGSSTRTR